jgi:protocatechuate 3,4-dioxygenase beta subunit
VQPNEAARFGVTPEPGKPQMTFTRSGVTGDDGRFTIVDLVPESGYFVRARSKGGLLGSKQSLEAIRDFIVDVGDVALLRGAIVKGIVRTDAGAPVAGVEIIYGWGPSESIAISDEDGRFTSDVLPPGKPRPRVRAKGYAVTSNLQRELIEGDVIDDLVVELVRAEPIRGRIVDELGRGVAQAWVNCWREQQEQMMFEWNGDSTQSGADGAFEFTSLSPGKYQVSVNKLGFRGESQQGVVAGSPPIELRLAKISTIEGSLVDAESGKPIEGVSARILVEQKGNQGNASFRPSWRGAETEFQADGSFKVSFNETGRIKVEVTAAGYAPGESPILEATENSEIKGLVLRLAAGIVLPLRVVDKTSREPVEGVILSVAEGGGNKAASFPQGFFGPGSSRQMKSRAVTDAAGVAKLDGLYTGTFTVTAKRPGFAPTRSDPVTLELGAAPSELVIELGRGGAIEGLAADARGNPELGLRVMAVPAEGHERREAVTDDRGRYRIDGVPAGRYRVEAMLEGEDSGNRMGYGGYEGENPAPLEQRFPVLVADGAATTHDLTVTRVVPGSLNGVAMLNGVPAPGLMVLLAPMTDDSDFDFDRNTKTDALGQFKFRSLKPGKYAVTIGRTWERIYGGGAVEVTAGQLAQITVDVALGVARGVVVDPKGQPLAGVQIWFELKDDGKEGEAMWGGTRVVESAGDGTFEIDELQAGSYDVTLSRRELKRQRHEGLMVAARRETGPLRYTLGTGGWIAVRLLGIERLGEQPRLRFAVTNEGGDAVSSSYMQRDSDGRYWVECDGVSAGKIEIYQRRQDVPNFLVGSAPFRLEKDENLALDVQLP